MQNCKNIELVGDFQILKGCFLWIFNGFIGQIAF